ncbi:Gamma-interferon-inducible lysosomal thiol reductase [Chionoecetes opilio]|uniref:Gamma-interferon-inducible lysosomal thiol reductase n=1 Tax=Chionoecetes opilio TaxID=41210 RepID=A0A8J8WN13_CHIOP|nr:Gamma-interferon-inducible lysosomal thiol reductase [Chionoecetes opilio]
MSVQHRIRHRAAVPNVDLLKDIMEVEMFPSVALNCAGEVGADWKPIEECVGSLEGQNLLHDVGVQQEQLKPPMKFVPWIIVNDVFSKDQMNECRRNLLSVWVL